MIRFKNFISELAMHGGTFADVEARLRGIATIGFEFETVVDKSSIFFTQNRPDIDVLHIKKFDTLDEFKEYFDIPKDKLKDIENDYDTWLGEMANEHVANTWETHIDSFDNHTEAMNYAREDFWKNEYQKQTIDVWIQENFSNGEKFVEHYELEPNYGWDIKGKTVYTLTIDELEDKEWILHNVAKSLRIVIDEHIEVYKEYHQGDKSSALWYVEPDSSIRGGIGVEIVTPAKKLNLALKDLQIICNWIKKNDVFTNESTGFHINVSLPNLIKKLDPVKLILFLGENYAAKMFDRVNIEFARNIIPEIISSIQTSIIQFDTKMPEDFEKLKTLVYSYLPDSKYFTINLDKLRFGYIEFRFAGNKDYEKDTVKLKEAIMRCVSAVEIACDPDAEKKLYIKKLSKVLDKIKSFEVNFDAKKHHELPHQFLRLARLDPKLRIRFLDFKKGDDRKLEHLFILLAQCAQTISKFKLNFLPNELAFLKLLIKQNNLTLQLVDQFFQELGHLIDISRKEFKLIYRI